VAGSAKARWRENSHKVPPSATDTGFVFGEAQASGPPLEVQSRKSYAVAVVLSSLLGWMGMQHFYLGRWAEGLLDIGLSLGWICAFLVGEPLWGVLLLVADFGHAMLATILLLIGSYRDGEGLRVCYPGQRLRPTVVG
jgi:TM2 domain-containing membrane protein YozV